MFSPVRILTLLQGQLRLSACILFFVASLQIPFAQEAGFGPALSVPRDLPRSASNVWPGTNWIDQSEEEAMRKSRGCLDCHKGIDTLSMHTSKNVVLGCTDCHGGLATPGLNDTRK